MITYTWCGGIQIQMGNRTRKLFVITIFLEIWLKIFAPNIVLQPVRNVPLLLYSSAGVLSLTLLGPIRFRVRYFDLHFKRKLAGGKWGFFAGSTIVRCSCAPSPFCWSIFVTVFSNISNDWFSRLYRGSCSPSGESSWCSGWDSFSVWQSWLLCNDSCHLRKRSEPSTDCCCMESYVLVGQNIQALSLYLKRAVSIFPYDVVFIGDLWS